MLTMSKNNGTDAPRERTASAIRQAAQSGAPPGPATVAQPKRRTFTAKYKRRILREVDDARASGKDGAVGALLRREGLYSSHLTQWRKQRDAGELAGLTPNKRGRKSHNNPLAEENERLRCKVERLELELRKAQTIIDVQKKVAALLGETLPEVTERDLNLARRR
jgi:transposase